MIWQPMDSAPKDRKIIVAFRGRDDLWIVEIREWKDDAFAARPKPYWCSAFGPTRDRRCVPELWTELPTPGGEKL